jgi:hypothetical protein
MRMGTDITKSIGLFAIVATLLFAASTSLAQAEKSEKKPTAAKEANPVGETKAKEAKNTSDEAPKDTAKEDKSKEDKANTNKAEGAKPAEASEGDATTSAPPAKEASPAENGTATPPAQEPAASAEEKPAQEPPKVEMTGTTTAASARDKTETETAPVAPPVPPPKKERRLRHLVTVSYEMSVPIGATWDFVGKFSPRGISIDYLYYLTPQVGLGVMMGWNDFEIKEKGTFTDQRVTLTGTQIRRLDTWYFNGAFSYNFLPIDQFATPYLGLNMGVYRTRNGIDYGWWGSADESWHFGFAPDAGVNLNFKKFLLQLGCRFHWAIQTSSADGERWVTFNIGFSVPGY